jgi:hypothetical protein
LEYIKIPDVVFQENPTGSSWFVTDRKHEADSFIFAILGYEHSNSQMK